jgi:class 3 adenylate cyclase/predicted ATPase
LAPVRQEGLDVDIADWLRGLGLGQYEAAFRDNDVELELLPSLTAEDLRDLGVASVGHRRRLLAAIAALSESAKPVPVGVPPVPEPVDGRLSSRAERRQLTVMFIDLVGSTELSRSLDPEDMGAVIRAYQNTVAGEITRFEGHLAKYMGDGVLGYFGWPAAHEDEAERAVRAALGIVAAVSAIRAPSGLALQARIGIATGMVVVGDLVGEGAALEETVIGETPNLAARLQERADAGGVVIAASTRRLIGSLFRLHPLGDLRLKGFDQPVTAFVAVGEGASEGRFAALRDTALVPLVGRAQELALLLERWVQAKAGEGQVVQLLGEPGIGKSRVLESLRDRLADEPHTRVRYFCSPYHRNSALYPITTQLVRAAGLERDDPPATKLAKLERLAELADQQPAVAVPMLAALLGVEASERYALPELTPQRRKARTFEVLLDHLSGLAARQPVLMLYEDLQWVDPTTLELLDLVIGRIEQQRVLVVATCRPEWSPRWIGHPNVSLLTINRLSRALAASIVDGMLQGRELPAPVREQILARSDGVPLFVEELTRAVLDSGLVGGRDDDTAGQGQLPPFAIPATLQDSLMARLGRLAPVKEVAQTGAVIGREFSFDLLSRVSPMAKDELADALDKLVAADLVFQRGSPPDATYVFKHALVQDAAYESLLRSRRHALHARIAAALEERHDETIAQPEVIARHWANAGLPERAVDRWTEAGQQALGRSATTESMAHFNAALADLAKLPVSPERDRRELAIQRAMGSALVAAHGFAAPETGRAYERALELTERIGDLAELFPILYGLGLYHLYGADLAAARSDARRLLDLAESGNDNGFLFFAHRAAGVSDWPAGRFADARGHLERALSLYNPAEHRAPAFVYAFDPRVVCLDYLARALLPLGHVGEAMEVSREALAQARRLGHRHSLCLALFYGAALHQLLGDRRAVARMQAELALIAAEERFPIWAAGAAVLGGWVRADAGEAQAGSAAIAAGIADWRATGAGLMLPYFEALLAEAEARCGLVKDACVRLRGAIRRAEATGELWFAAELHRRLAATLAASGDMEAARAELETAIEVAKSQGAGLWRLRATLGLAECLTGAGDEAGAAALLAPALTGVDGCSGLPELVRAPRLAADNELKRVHGLCGRSDGDRDVGRSRG